MKRIERINYQRSTYYQTRKLKSVIYLKSDDPAGNYILSDELKLVKGSKNDESWYKVHEPAAHYGWSKPICRITQDLNDEFVYNGVIHTEDYSVIISINILPKLKFCTLKAFGFFNPKELFLTAVA